MNKTYHKTLLVNEVLEYLDPQPEKVYVDATFGGGGHTKAILDKEPKCKVIAIDWDKNSLEKNGAQLKEIYQDRLTLLWGNFAHLHRLLKKEKIDYVDGILADFGTSQFQIKELPGFSFSKDTFLDMRMSPAHQKLTAAEVINKFTPKQLEEIFFSLGEERHSRKIVKVIIEERKKYKINTTAQLSKIIENIIPRNSKMKIHPATKVFQALRIYVNEELENISSFLIASLDLLNVNGRLVCISFHSLEDRIVKQFMKSHKCDGVKGFKILTPKIVQASEQEVKENPSSRSAKLRAAQVCEDK